MLEKIKVSLKNKYKDLGLSDAVVLNLAELLNNQVKEESEIDVAVEGVASLAKGVQSYADSRVDLALKKKPNPEPEEEPNPTTPTQSPLELKMQELLQKMESLEAEKSKGDRSKLFLESIKGIKSEETRKMMLSQFERMTFADDSDFTTFVSSNAAYVESLVKLESASSLENNLITNIGNAKEGEVSESVKNLYSKK